MARINLPEGKGLDVGKALAMAPHFVDVVVGYEKAIAQTTIDPRLHELVRYRVAQLNQCTVCLDFRRDDSGLTEEVLAQVESYATSDAFSAVEKTALRFAEQFCTDSAGIPDSLLAELGERLTPAEIIDLTLVVGKYLTMGRFMQVLGLDQACTIDPARLAGAAEQ
ncbi:MAG: 4-carboxymuconolactone decarboxylase domain/alkylhydroperoxidase AhpD family core domain protein [Frankiales bacterium]|nr:4-carboxymuconolactone decarboxylase domain/alkylhydroperoxidase AhpD family core domain protein [Frankiales bacterium]